MITTITKYLTWSNTRLALLVFPIAIDCLANMILFQNSWRNTVSGECWNQRENPRWKRAWRYVDAVFGKDHCRIQSEIEAKYGSVWAALRAGFKAKSSPPQEKPLQ